MAEFEILIYLIVLMFLIVINIIGAIKMPLICVFVAIASIVLAVASIEAFGDMGMIPIMFLIINLLISIFGLTRAK